MIATRPARLRSVTLASGEGRGVVGFKAGKGCIEHFPAWHEDDIQSRRRLLSPEQLAGETFCPIPDNGGTELACGGNPESAPAAAVWRHEQDHEPAGQLQAVFIRALEFRTPSDPLVSRKALRHRALARVTARPRR